MAPQFVGVEVVVLGTQFVGFLGALFGGFACVSIATLHDARHTIIDGGVQENADHGAVFT